MTDRANPEQIKRKKLTRDALTRAAYRYLERFASTEAQLVKILWARIDRELKAGGDDLRQDARATAVEIARRCTELGLVNDRLYGEVNARRLLARGKPLRAIRAALMAKGVGQADIDAALDQLAIDREGEDLDFAAAVAYARRRRLGPFRRLESMTGEAEDDPRRRKEYATMARAGFGYEQARRILELSTPEELEDQV